MPVVQGTIDRGEAASMPSPTPSSPAKRRAHVLPGAVPVELGHAAFRLGPYPLQRVMLVAPPTVQVTSAGFTPAGTEQGFNLYTRDADARGHCL